MSTKKIEVGEKLEGQVRNIISSGVFIDLGNGKDGFLHISQITGRRIENINDYVKRGDLFRVKIKEIDEKGRVRLENMDIEVADNPKRERGSSDRNSR